MADIAFYISLFQGGIMCDTKIMEDKGFFVSHHDTLKSEITSLVSKLVTSKGIKRGEKEQKFIIENLEIKYNLTDIFFDNFKPTMFINRKSYRGHLNYLDENTILRLIASIKMSPSYRPTPLAGNIDFLRIFVLNNEHNIYYADLKRSDPIKYLTNKKNNDFKIYLQEALNRVDISEKKGTYIFPFTNVDALYHKYFSAAVPLAFITIGCLLQNISLALSELSLRSCIHFGMKKDNVWCVDGKNYIASCFVRTGV